MAVKVLGQLAPSAATASTLYTVPGGKSAVCSTLSVCNRSTTPTSYRVAIRPGAATLSNEHYIVYDLPIPANSADAWTIGVTLAATDVVTVYATLATVSFSLFGDES